MKTIAIILYNSYVMSGYFKACACGKPMDGYSKRCMACYQKHIDDRLISRLMTYVEKTRTCWLWTGVKDIDGYGKTNVRSKLIRSHRLFYELFKGPVPSDKFVCHSCDNPPCVNPEHLHLGTNQQNHLEKRERKRIHGERNPNSRVTEKDVREMRSLYPSLKLLDLSKKFGISMTQVSNIVRHKSWSN